MERCFRITDGGTNMSTFLGVGCMKLWQLIRRKMATEIWGFVRCIPGYWSQNSTFPEDALKLSFRWDAALQDCTAFNPPSQRVSEWGGGSIETGLDVHSWLLFSRPDLDLADTAAAQCWNAWTLPALLKRHGLPNRARFPNRRLWSLSASSRLKSSPSTRMAQMSAEQRQAAMEAAQRWVPLIQCFLLDLDWRGFAGPNLQRGIRRWRGRESVGSWRRPAGRTRPASSRRPSSGWWTAGSSPSKKVRKWENLPQKKGAKIGKSP